MLNCKISPTRVAQHSLPAQIKEWLTKEQCLKYNLILVAIDNDRLTIHEAAGGEWLASLNWSGKWIIVEEPKNITFPYEFREFNNALSFLDALLLHHFTRTSEDPRENCSAGGIRRLRNATIAVLFA